MMHGCIKTWRVLLATTAMTLLAAPLATRAASVKLMRHAEVKSDTIILSDVATLAGSDARQYAGIVVDHMPTGQQKAVVTLSKIRQSLSKAGANWGLISLRGYQKCQVHHPKAEPKHTAKTVPHVKAPDGGKANVGGGLTLGDRICAKIAELAGVKQDQLRIIFNDHDTKLLADPAFGMRVSYEPMASSFVGRVPVVIREYSSDDDLARSFTVTATVSEKVAAVVATKKINRGDLFTSENTTVKTVWLTRDRGQVETRLADVHGQAASAILHEGDLVTADIVKTPTLVKRGQMMTVRCISGSLVIRTTVRAEQNGAKGDTIKARNEVSNQTLMVTVTGPRLGMIKMGDDDRQASFSPTKGSQQ